MKFVAHILLIALSLNLVLATANAAQKSQELHTLFGEEIYICFADESFDLAIDDYEKLLFWGFENNKHENSNQSDLAIAATDIFEFNYQATSSLIKLGLLKTNFASTKLKQNIQPRAPPFIS